MCLDIVCMCLDIVCMRTSTFSYVPEFIHMSKIIDVSTILFHVSRTYLPKKFGGNWVQLAARIKK